MFVKTILPAARMLLVLTILTGVVYPVAITLVAQVVFPAQANGSLETVDDTVVGSSLIGQQTSDERYFWSRPSAVNTMLGSTIDSPGSSGATNAGMTSAALAEQVAEREAAFRAANNNPADMAVPADMLFTSGSGLDPHISPEAARLQIDRVADARGLDRETVAALVEQYVEPPQLGLFGQPRVNVLLLNLALDQLQ
jgi:K+-transporting ATPase ATPase C chain